MPNPGLAFPVRQKMGWAALAVLLAFAGPSAAAAEARDQAFMQDLASLEAALKAELGRGLSELSLPGMPRPYFISAVVTDTDAIRVAATLGGLQTSQHHNQRALQVEVRVGGYEFDDSNFMGDGWVQRARLLPLEMDPLSVQRAAWLLIDGAYKDATARFEAKRSIRHGQAASEERPQSFARVEPQRFTEVEPAAPGPEADWVALARRLSAAFRPFNDLLDSGVVVASAASRRLLVTTEGSQIADSGAQVTIVAWATTQAPDGMMLRHHAVFVADDRSALPSETDMEAAVRTVAQELGELSRAPVVDNYSGPVLFEGIAAGQLLEALVAQQVSGTPPPESSMGEIPANNPWSSRVNLRVLPKGFSVTDDPTLERWGTAPLMGHYAYDDEGVPAQHVELVSNGILRQLLMSRTPSKESGASNGHGRFGYSTAAVGWPSNLVVRAAPGLGRAALRARLRQVVRDDGLPYGLVVRCLDEPMVFMMVSGLQGVGASFPHASRLSAAVIVRVYPDGKEQLVRGASLDSMETGDLRNILAAGARASVYHSVPTALRLMSSRAGNAAGLSIVAPDLLVDRVEVNKVAGPYAKGPLLGRPAVSP